MRLATLAALVTAPLALASCRHPGPPLEATPQEEAACAAARTAYESALRAAACEHDWDCWPAPSWETGRCGFPTNKLALNAAEPLRRNVFASCHRLAEFTAACPELVGSCENHVCALRERRPSPEACTAALANLERARDAIAGAGCAIDGDCATVEGSQRRAVNVVGASLQTSEAEHAVEDACSDAELTERHVRLLSDREPGPRYLGGHAACEEGRCTVQPARKWTAPRSEEGCLARNVSVPIQYQGAVGKVLMKFAVATDGVPYRFEILGAPAPLARALVKAVRSCPWQPARDDHGRPIEVFTIVPIRFARW